MGGDYTQDGNMEHRPYTSVRKLFYDFPVKSELDNSMIGEHRAIQSRRQSNEEGRFSKILQKSAYDDDITFTGKSNEVMQHKRNRRISMNLKFISRFSESYSDLYFEPMRRQSDSKLLKSSWMTRSENKLNLPDSFYKNFPAKRVQSFDTSKFQQRASAFYPSDGWSESFEYSIYDDTESSHSKSPVDGHWSNDEDTDKENSIKKSHITESPQPFHKCSSSSFGSHWSSVSDSHNGYLLPWTKRQQKSKKNRPKSKSKLRECRISSSFDKIRTDRYEHEENNRVSMHDSEADLLPRFDYEEKNSVMTNLRHSRRSLYRKSYHVAACCDGVFGCD